MNIGDVFECEILSQGINGEGVARIDNFVVFVPFALPNEKVKIEIVSVKKSFANAKILEITKKSSQRTLAPCPYFSVCGGCQIQCQNYLDQLSFKRDLVAQTLKKFLLKDVLVNETVRSEQYNYRNKIELLFGENGLGYYSLDNSSIIPIKNCLLFAGELEHIINVFNKYITNELVYNKVDDSGVAKALFIRCIEGRYSLTVVVTNNIDRVVYDFIVKDLKKFGVSFSLYESINTIRNSTNITPIIRNIYNPEKQKFNASGIVVEISPNSFLQVNNEVSAKMYEDVKDLISENDNVLNAYSGAGLLSAIIATKAKKVFGVEIIENASKDADELCRRNRLRNVKNICGDCSKEIDKIIYDLEINDEQLNTIILDPPRKGCDEKVLASVCGCGVKKIIYISCNPASLGRDLSILQNYYSIEQITPYDMFPQTSKVETVVCLIKKP